MVFGLKVSKMCRGYCEHCMHKVWSLGKVRKCSSSKTVCTDTSSSPESFLSKYSFGRRQGPRRASHRLKMVKLLDSRAAKNLEIIRGILRGSITPNKSRVDHCCHSCIIGAGRRYTRLGRSYSDPRGLLGCWRPVLAYKTTIETFLACRPQLVALSLYISFPAALYPRLSGPPLACGFCR